MIIEREPKVTKENYIKIVDNCIDDILEKHLNKNIGTLESYYRNHGNLMREMKKIISDNNTENVKNMARIQVELSRTLRQFINVAIKNEDLKEETIECYRMKCYRLWSKFNERV